MQGGGDVHFAWEFFCCFLRVAFIHYFFLCVVCSEGFGVFAAEVKVTSSMPANAALERASKPPIAPEGNEFGLN